MKCIDAIEGTVKSILDRLYQQYASDNLDDSEYVRNVKAVIEAIDSYLQINPELVENPDLLQKVLYEHSRNLWLFGKQQEEPPNKPVEPMTGDQEEYQTYYFDYLYHRGIYPR